MKVEINEEFVILEMCLSLNGEVYNARHAMLEMILFWTGGEDRLDINGGDVTKTFLEQLGREAFIIMQPVNGNFSISSVNSLIKEFNNREGWAQMDGSCGIKIVDVEAIEIDYKDFEIEEVNNG